MKKTKSFRLDTLSITDLENLANETGLSQTEIIEKALRIMVIAKAAATKNEPLTAKDLYKYFMG